MYTTNYIMRLPISTSDQKLYTEFWLSPFSICLWLDGINLWFQIHLDNKSKERFYNQRAPGSKCKRTKIVDKDILITYGFSDRKLSQPIITMSELPQEQEIWSNSASSLCYKLLANAMWIRSLSKKKNWNEIHWSRLCAPWPYHFIW